MNCRPVVSVRLGWSVTLDAASDPTGFAVQKSPWQPLEINLLKPNDIYIYIYIYICRTAALTSRRYILNIYSTNIHTEYFKHAA